MSLELGLPAMFLAGVQASAHCVLMCGVINLRPEGPQAPWWAIQGGRLLAYSTLGALAGALGGQGVRLMPQAESAMMLRLALGALIMAMALLSWRQRHRSGLPCAAHQQMVGRGNQSLSRAMGQGLLWGLMPCPLLYLALLGAVLSASPWLGFAFLWLFGLGTVPALGLQMWLFGRRLDGLLFNRRRRSAWMLICGSVIVLSSVYVGSGSSGFCWPA